MTYFHASDDVWKAIWKMKGIGDNGMWKINKAFLKQQIKSGASFTLSEPSSGHFYAKEYAYIIKHKTLTKMSEEVGYSRMQIHRTHKNFLDWLEKI